MSKEEIIKKLRNWAELEIKISLDILEEEGMKKSYDTGYQQGFLRAMRMLTNALKNLEDPNNE